MKEAKERLDLQNCPDRLQAALHNQRFEFVLNHISHVDTALEVGTGVGSFSPMLADRCGQYTGVEFDPESAAQTAKRLGANARVMQGDARDLPFDSASFSAVVCLEVLEHLGDYQAGVREIQRCLKPEGVAFISVPYRRNGAKSSTNVYHLYEPGESELVACLAQGFREVEVRYQYFQESPLMALSRRLHLRRLLGTAGIYKDLADGESQAIARLKIEPKAKGLKLHLVIIARNPKPGKTS